MSGKKNKKNIVWADLEMTGLDPNTDEIIEIAVLITDPELNIIAEGPELIINQPASRFELMDNWNQTHHKDSGLWDKVVSSKITVKEAEKEVLDFVREFTEQNKAPLAGNSIWQDRRFIVNYMKNLDEYLHYRMIDVSSIKELVGRWYPKQETFKKQNSHRALDDIKESIEELKFFRKHFFVPQK